MKSKVDKLDVDKLKPVPVDVKKISEVVDEEVLKNSKYNAYKIALDKKIKILKNKMPNVKDFENWK